MSERYTSNRTTYFRDLQLNQPELFPTQFEKSSGNIQTDLKNLQNNPTPLEFSSPTYNPLAQNILEVVHTVGHPTTGGLQGKNTRGKEHGGIDIKADIGTPIQAAEKGVVVFTGDVSGYGRVVYVNHRDGYQTRYAHLNEGVNGIQVKIGDIVQKGEVIGESGKTGNAAGNDVLPHLHFEVRRLNNETTLDSLATSNKDSTTLNPIDKITRPNNRQFNLEGPEMIYRKAWNALMKH